MSRPVAIFTSRTEAELAKARLELEGIPAHILTDDAGGWEPQFGLSRGVRLMVADHDAASAAEVLDLRVLRPLDTEAIFATSTCPTRSGRRAGSSIGCTAMRPGR